MYRSGAIVNGVGGNYVLSSVVLEANVDGAPMILFLTLVSRV
jgi:hypothetical protein